MDWLVLVIAGMFEIGWAVSLKFSQGFTKLIPSIITVVLMIVSLYFLSIALKSIPLGTAYAIWTSIGTAGTLIIGIMIFNESIEPISLICIGIILTGIIESKVISPD